MNDLSYLDYHNESMKIGDVDPSYAMLRYVCNRFELNDEQRYWLAFLYATCYCGPTVFYIYNEFPDFENVDVGRLERWWAKNKQSCVFQTDRMRIRSNNHFVPMFSSYRDWIGGLTQKQFWSSMNTKDPFLTYDVAFEQASKLFQMGRFSLFLFLEAVNVVTGFPMRPRSMRLRDAESCRNGFAEAIGRPDLNNHDGRLITSIEQNFLQIEFDKMVAVMTGQSEKNSVWNIETTLCAYKKYKLGKRFVGYYLNRQAEEIEKMENNVKSGVDWSVLWQYRAETYSHTHLKEFS